MELRIGVAGLGAIGVAHIERITKKLHGGRVVAATDAVSNFGVQVAGHLGITYHSSIRAMIESGGIDALLVTAADEDHERYVLAGIRAVIPVFCEKPLAPDAMACQRIIEAEMEVGQRMVQVGFMRRYDAGYRSLKAMIASRQYGRPLMIHCAQRSTEVGESFTTDMAISNALIHEIDILRWLLGEDYDSVEIRIPKGTRNSHRSLRDPQILLMTSESGVWMDVECFLNCHAGYDIQCEVVCEEGILRLPDPPTIQRLTAATRMRPICNDWTERFEAAYDAEIQDWINSSLAGDTEGPSAWDGYAACLTADAARQSRETERAVPVELPECPKLYM